MKAANSSNMALCPDCERRVRVGGTPRLGNKLICPHCDAYLRVVDLNPIELDWDSDDYDDWNSNGDDWDDDDW